MSDKKDLPRPAQQQKPVGVVFNCGTGRPCKITYTYENPPQPVGEGAPRLPTPKQSESK